MEQSKKKEMAARLAKGIVALADLASILRGPNGCPWDAAQTDDTIKLYLLEEAYEVVEAVEKKSPEEICSELGDLLFQIVFLAQLAAERGEFDLADVVEHIHHKMVRRHPHVFGEENASKPEEVARRWAELKREEGNGDETQNELDRVPRSLPALLRAHRLDERASKMGKGRQPTGQESFHIEELVRALGSAISKNDKGAVGEKIGRLLFELARLARLWSLNAEDLLRRENENFVKSSGLR